MKRRGLLLLLAIPLLLVALLAALVFSLPAERIGALAARRASEALGREVQVAGVHLRLLPRPAVSLDGVQVAGAAADTTPLLSAARVELRPRLLPLLARRVYVDAVVLDHPVVRFRVDSAGLSNLPTPSDTASSANGGSTSAEFAVRRLEIRDGRLGYSDARSGTVVELDSVNQRLSLSGDVEGGELGTLRTDGTLEVGSLDARVPGALAVPIKGLRVRLEHAATLDRRADVLELDRLALDLERVQLTGSGRIEHVSDSTARAVDLRLETGDFDLADLLASLPPSLRGGTKAAGRELSAGGTASIAARIRGRVGAGAKPDVAGTFALRGGSLALRPGGEVASGVRGDVAFSLDSLVSRRVNLTLLGRPVAVAFDVRDLSAPRGRVAVKGQLDLARLSALGLLPDSVATAGVADVDVRAGGAALEPANAVVEGTVALHSVAVKTPSLPQPVRLGSGRVVLAGRDLKGEGFQGRVAGSDFGADFSVRDWLALALNDSTRMPRVAFDARSKLLDLDALRPEPSRYQYSELFWARMRGTDVKGLSPDAAADSAGLALPELPRMELQGRLRAATLRNGGTEFRDVDVSLGGHNGQLEVRDASFRLMGGGVEMAGRLGRAPAPDAPHPLVVSFSLKDVGMQPFLQRFTAFREHLSGAMLLTGDAQLLLDQHLLPERESVAGTGRMALSDGRLVAWPILKALGEKLGRSTFDTLSFRDWHGNLEFAGPRVVLRSSTLTTDQTEIELAGWFDVNGRLDVGGTLRAPTAWTRGLGGAQQVAAAAAGPDGRVPVGVAVTGTVRSPSLRLDLSKAAASAAAVARQKAEAEAKAQARKVAEHAAEKVVGPLPAAKDSAAAAVDTAKQRLQRAVGQKLKGLFGGRTKADSVRPDTTRPDTTGGA